MNDDTPMCERHETTYIHSRGYQNQNSHDLYYDPKTNNDSEKSLAQLNNDVKQDLEHFKSCIRSMRTVHDKFFDRDDQSKIDLEKLITKFLDGQRVSNMFGKNNVNDMNIKMMQNKNNCQTIYNNMERKIDKWSKSQNRVSSEQTDRTDPPPPLAQTEHVNAVFTGSGNSDNPPKVQKDPPRPIIVNNKIKKDKPIKTSKRGYYMYNNGLTDFVPGHAVMDAAHHKSVKYEAKCADIGYGFLPFSFSSLGELEKDAVALLMRI
ncbi:hypothetical protein Tco_1519086 [Tanacetum coccineum]